ncbi:unnamed protein product [Schistosoma margrebowiei]|uniref:DUF6451 domain-containing protein n=1 Tax=Schistosoma margrebowiei TaxID=48269 RepID=A0A3P8IFD2_9TREM|nr:unnamed protein product [Schistosoma margrebowiei]
MGSIIDEHGGYHADVKARIGKARAAYLQLKNIWNSKQLSTNTKVNIFYTNVKKALLYGAETWRTTKAIIQKKQVFINSCLCKILRIRWPDTISNNLLWEIIYLFILTHRYWYKEGIWGEIKPDSIEGRNREEAPEVNITHIEESTKLHCKRSPHMESSRPKEKRKIKEHITPGNGDRHEKSEQELDGTKEEGPGQSGLENDQNQVDEYKAREAEQLLLKSNHNSDSDPPGSKSTRYEQSTLSDSNGKTSNISKEDKPLKCEPNRPSGSISWLRPKLIVRCLDRNYCGGKYNKEKLIIISIDGSRCSCKTKSGQIIEGLPIKYLQTIIPHETNSVLMIVNGERSGQDSMLALAS